MNPINISARQEDIKRFINRELEVCFCPNSCLKVEACLKIILEKTGAFDFNLIQKILKRLAMAKYLKDMFCPAYLVYDLFPYFGIIHHSNEAIFLGDRVKQVGGIELFEQVAPDKSKISEVALDILKNHGVDIALPYQEQRKLAPQVLWLIFKAQEKLCIPIQPRLNG